MLVLVTGASSGFGEAMVRRFLQSGHRVIAAARREEKLHALQDAMGKLGESMLPVVLDVADKDSISAFFEGLPEEWRDIDVLINNAGLALGIAPAQLADLDDWETMIDTNNKGLVRMTRAMLPHFVGRKNGLIINIGSIAGSTAYPGANVYGATKAFVDQFTLNLRADLIGTGVRATNIAPGLCGGTEFSNVRFKGDAAKAAAVYQGTEPLTAEDIAETAYWIATLPSHINVNHIEMMPTCQGYGPLAIQRQAN
ncbi:SDR family NAD(P)-dependent oxidoreductase [Undibacterium fentianense]|uniref:SDR family NAD(P)-dependent oxidoreductase n=1 Tax=Undibacterium fentianense TaxID=2828728 RepID=A0A941E2D2_9BURK|nr:SDR family NAD(P)-dependent oxidoreductase [Undibacterium fentianense]MBR7801085.1 SDR family NAD(P)-dependent oxidoreductase [Undibacterium fentianense]